MAELDQSRRRLGDFRAPHGDVAPLNGAVPPDLPDAITAQLGAAGAPPATPFEYGSVAAPGGGYNAPGFIGGGLSDTGNDAGAGDQGGAALGDARVRELAAEPERREGGGRDATGARSPSIGEMSDFDLAEAIGYADQGVESGVNALSGGLVGAVRGQMVTELDQRGGYTPGTSFGDPTAALGGGRAGGVGTPGVGGGFGGSETGGGAGGDLGRGESPTGDDVEGTPFAHGGPVVGPGDGNDDAVNADLSNGEFVFPADAVAALGGGDTRKGFEVLMQMVNALQKPAGPTGLRSVRAGAPQ